MDRICIHICKCKRSLQISIILFVIRFVIVSSKTVWAYILSHFILQSHGLIYHHILFCKVTLEKSLLRVTFKYIFIQLSTEPLLFKINKIQNEIV